MFILYFSLNNPYRYHLEKNRKVPKYQILQNNYQYFPLSFSWSRALNKNANYVGIGKFHQRQHKQTNKQANKQRLKERESKTQFL